MTSFFAPGRPAAPKRPNRAVRGCRTADCSSAAFTAASRSAPARADSSANAAARASWMASSTHRASSSAIRRTAGGRPLGGAAASAATATPRRTDINDHARHDGQGVSHRRGPPVNWGNGLADSESCRAATGSTRSGTSTPSPGGACSPATAVASSTTTARSCATTAASCGSPVGRSSAAGGIPSPPRGSGRRSSSSTTRSPWRRDTGRARRAAATPTGRTGTRSPRASGRAGPLLAADLNQRLAGERLRRGRGLVRAPDRRTWSGADRRASRRPRSSLDDELDPRLLLDDRTMAFTFDGWVDRSADRRAARSRC